MAPAAKSTTPGRRKKTDNQYFDVGKVGRKTGITLKDTGIRDEHGLEPVSGIFSSPTSPDQNGGRTLTSEGMDLEDDSAPDITQTLTGRRVHMPPPRQTTPRHTNIGSPKRMSSARPTSRSAVEDAASSQPLTNAPANRRLDFAGTNRNRKSVNVVDGSPFKPRKILRRSDGPVRRSIYEQVDEEEEVEDEAAVDPTIAGVEDDSIEHSIEDNDQIMMEDDVPEVEDDQSAISVTETQAPAKRKPGRPRKSDQSNASLVQHSPQVERTSSAGKKRTRTSMNDTDNSISQVPVIASGSRPKKSRTSNTGSIPVLRDSYAGDDDAYPIEVEDYPEDEQPEEMEVDAQLNSQLQEEPEPQPQPRGKGRPKGKGKKAIAPKERDANRSMQKKGSPVKINDSPSKRHRGGSAGPVSNVQLRAVTPFDDSNQTTSRAGRNLIQPLKFWQNESLIWKGGEIEGVIRADPVEQSRAASKKRRKSKKPKRSKLNAIEEESDTESILPDEWEEEMGVITGNIAAWNPLTNTADPGGSKQEDIAFAASSIVTRDVPGSQFKYAKIMTLPFFGAGVVELPPGGFKRAKNSRKMQMVFFVHEGKVLVEVGATGLEINEFALSKGGCWIVPRGKLLIPFPDSFLPPASTAYPIRTDVVWLPTWIARFRTSHGRLRSTFSTNPDPCQWLVNPARR
ncbi:uncharacterized protein RCC_09584 [Ramularia collo-cygni]|uniref:Mif2/CENP-C cupin domain-containing protein n=1 Tax=Ramularia collo-cygni TaxID=112498 RepID=A0A2D3VKE5_9PEZI|nr:uncharacterized protein RCC_09584 [Ramularia collo-cygni]CZT23869.1 uncharacterized protein RCC_09584 [Ramularia collo-cygni]